MVSIWEGGLTRGSPVLYVMLLSSSYLVLLAQVAGVSSDCSGLPSLYGETVRALAAGQEQRAAGSTAPVALPRRKPPPSKVSTRDLMGKWQPAGSDFCSSSDMDMTF